MAVITYIEFNGTEHTVDVPEGTTLMEGAVNQGIDGIVAECGGSCACATCHVYVENDWIDKLPTMDSIENDLLEFPASPRERGSRLSCQLVVAKELDGLVVRLPEAQV